MRAGDGVDGIVCFSTDPWGDMKRPVQLMRCLAREVPVLYVEPYLSATSIARNAGALASEPLRSRVGRAVSRGVAEVDDGVHVLTSLVAVPPQRLSFASPAVMARAACRQYEAAAHRAFKAAEVLGMRRPALWISYPGTLTDARDGRRMLQVYDCMDRWTDFPDTAADAGWHRIIAQAEHRLFAESDLVFCSAEGLVEWARERARGDVSLVRNGAQVEHFEPADRACPADIAGLPRPILGYAGAVAEWVDFKLLRAVALARPDWSIVLVGPVFRGKTMGDRRAMEPVLDLPNVHVLGPRPYDELPAYYEAFDVALIPFVRNGLTADTNPIKLYEYLAAGAPVVSTPLREVATVPQAYLAETPEQFANAVERAMGERRDPGRIAARIAAAREHSWQARASVVWETLRTHERGATA